MKENKMDKSNLEVFMELIIHSGNGKSDAFEAIQLAKEGNFEQAEEKMAEAKTSLLQAHHVQTDMLTEEAKGNPMEVSLLAIHSQDHLMTAMTFMDLAKEIIEVYQNLAQS